MDIREIGVKEIEATVHEQTGPEIGGEFTYLHELLHESPSLLEFATAMILTLAEGNCPFKALAVIFLVGYRCGFQHCVDANLPKEGGNDANI
jgi:hypothetical protein